MNTINRRGEIGITRRALPDNISCGSSGSRVSSESTEGPLGPWLQVLVNATASNRARASFYIWSSGADGEKGGKGYAADIGNWNTVADR